LNWQPLLEFEETIKMTVEWYREFYQNNNKSMHIFSLSQIDEYTKLAISRDSELNKA